MEQLFGSKTRVKLLQLFLENPNRSFYVREITRKVDEQINSVRRELANLLSIGIITSDSTNNKLYYEVDQQHQLYPALHLLVTGKKAATQSKKQSEQPDEQNADLVADRSRPSVDASVWSKVGNISGIAYSGILTRDTKSPVDVMIIGDVPVASAEHAVAQLEKQEGRELRYAVMDVEEWQYRRQVNDKFLLQVMEAKKQVILDTQDCFREL